MIFIAILNYNIYLAQSVAAPYLNEPIPLQSISHLACVISD